jgi:adenine/guanine phosphoribosyltransferase-like PRPP-binding protein
VSVIGGALSQRLNIPLVDCVRKTRDAPQLKNVYDLDERMRLLDGLHDVDASATNGRKILLFDDLYRLGGNDGCDDGSALWPRQGLRCFRFDDNTDEE